MENNKLVLRTPRLIQEIVCEFYGIQAKKLSGKLRYREICFPRQLCMFLYKKYTFFSLKTIGAEFGGRDHSTVNNACNVIKDLMDTDEAIRSQIIMIDQRVRSIACSQDGIVPLSEEQMEFIRINHWLMTAAEMAKELGVHDFDVKAYCDQKKLQPITEKQRAVEFIKEHPNWNLRKLSKHLNMDRNTIRILCERYNLTYHIQKYNRLTA